MKTKLLFLLFTLPLAQCATNHHIKAYKLPNSYAIDRSGDRYGIPEKDIGLFIHEARALSKAFVTANQKISEQTPARTKKTCYACLSQFFVNQSALSLLLGFDEIYDNDLLDTLLQAYEIESREQLAYARHRMHSRHYYSEITAKGGYADYLGRYAFYLSDTEPDYKIVKGSNTLTVLLRGKGESDYSYRIDLVKEYGKYYVSDIGFVRGYRGESDTLKSRLKGLNQLFK